MGPKTQNFLCISPLFVSKITLHLLDDSSEVLIAVVQICVGKVLKLSINMSSEKVRPIL